MTEPTKQRIDAATIRHVADVARLELSDEEISEFLPQMEEILKSFSIIAEADISGCDISLQPVPLRDAFREDEVRPSLSQEDALSGTQHKKNGFFKGPKAL